MKTVSGLVDRDPDKYLIIIVNENGYLIFITVESLSVSTQVNRDKSLDFE